MSKVIFILVGNIGAGKSTITNYLVNKGFVAVARDRLRYSIGGGSYIWHPDYEPIVHETNMFMFYRFADLGVSMVMDEVNINRAARKKYLQYGHQHGYKILAIQMPRFSKEESIKRRLSANHGTTDAQTWGEVWERFDKQYQEPTMEEGFDGVLKLQEDIRPEKISEVIDSLTTQ